MVYKELRRIANGQIRFERSGHTLQATALVHEAYLQMLGQNGSNFQDRAHFLAIASCVMRRILIDHAREHKAAKRGGGDERVSLDEQRDAILERPAVLIALDGALNDLAKKDRLLSQLVEMRFFGGMTAEESSVALGLDIHLVRRKLRLAAAWLQREMGAEA